MSNGIKYTDWQHFRSKFLTKYHSMLESDRKRYIFRGQADARWKLETTLDRRISKDRRGFRDKLGEEAIRDFRRISRGIAPQYDFETDIEWELLGRHHGLPTAVLDFTRSPYVAAYFAFAEKTPPGANHASIWTIDSRGLVDLGDRIEVIDDIDLIRLNSRALQQEGLFLKVKDAEAFDAISAKYISRYDIPCRDEDRVRVLSELNAMMINGKNLFRDLDGVATNARINVFDLRGN